MTARNILLFALSFTSFSFSQNTNSVTVIEELRTSVENTLNEAQINDYEKLRESKIFKSVQVVVVKGISDDLNIDRFQFNLPNEEKSNCNNKIV